MRLKEFLQPGGKIEGLDQDLTGFYSELQSMFPGMKVTSARRYGNGVGKLGNKSRHNRGQAIDIAPTNEIRNFLTSQQGKSLLQKYKVGFLDESDSNTMKKTGATGAHFHIGKDSTLVGGNHSDDSGGHQYGDMSQFNETLANMSKGLYDYGKINEMYQKNPGYTSMMMDTFANEQKLSQDRQQQYEMDRLNQEKLNQEENKKITEQENLRIQAEFEQKNAERDQLLAMVPQSQSINSGQISPKMMQRGGSIEDDTQDLLEDTRNLFRKMTQKQWYNERIS